MIDYILSRFNSFSLDTKGLTPENLPSRTKKDFAHAPDSNILVIALPGWGQEMWTWSKVKKLVTVSSASFLAYEFPRQILSNNYQLTAGCFESINQAIRREIESLKNQYGFTRGIMLEVSLATSFGPMAYRNNPSVTDIVAIAPGNDLAENMWYGCRTQHLRRSYEQQGVTLEQLKDYWYDLASVRSMPAPKTSILAYMGTADKVLLYKQAKEIPDTWVKNGFNPVVKKYNLGHYFLLWYFLLFPQKFLSLR